MNGVPFAPFAERGKVHDPPSSAPYCTLTLLLRPAPRLCMNGVRAGVTQGQGRHPSYAPPLRSPRRLQGRGKVRDPSLCPRPLLYADAPLLPRKPPLRPAPVRARTGFVPTQGHGRRPSYAPPLHSPRRLRGHWKVCAFAPR
jgi:hypothetical protein